MKHLLWFFCLVFPNKFALGSQCGPEFKGKCYCGDAFYQDDIQLMVNCTNTGFTDTSVLQHLPEDIQVLIFTGNNIRELPWNVFGNLNNYDRLRVVDMSNNNIHEILGKTYHRVSNVERLVLNHNNISISASDHHPRIFSNFVNLKELHLTDAFVDKSENLASDLHDIFNNSNLHQLIKLHLEQNEITNFQDRKVFCDLPSLMDLHLGNNLLTGIDFEILCLKHLRFIDLEENKIKVLTRREMDILDEFPARKQNLTIDFRGNPFLCDCAFNKLFDWFNTTKVEIREKDFIRCYHYKGTAEEGTKKDCLPKKRVHTIPQVVTTPHNQASEIVLGFLLVVLIALFIAIIYVNRKSIKYKLNPVIDNVTRKVHYTSIGRDYEDQEVEV